MVTPTAEKGSRVRTVLAQESANNFCDRLKHSRCDEWQGNAEISEPVVRTPPQAELSPDIRQSEEGCR